MMILLERSMWTLNKGLEAVGDLGKVEICIFYLDW